MKRIISSVLVLAMLFETLPLSVLAADEPETVHSETELTELVYTTAEPSPEPEQESVSEEPEAEIETPEPIEAEEQQPESEELQAENEAEIEPVLLEAPLLTAAAPSITLPITFQKAQPFTLMGDSYTNLVSRKLQPYITDAYTGGEWAVSFQDAAGNTYASGGLATATTLPIPEDIRVSWCWNYYTDNYKLDGMVPVGLTRAEWNTLCTDYAAEFQAKNGRAPTDSAYNAPSPDYGELFLTLSGWTEDNRIPVYSDNDLCEGLTPQEPSFTAYGKTYSYRYYSAYVKLSYLKEDGTEELLGCYRSTSGARVEPQIVIYTQEGSDYLYDITTNPFTAGEKKLSCEITYGPVPLSYQWYETDGRDGNKVKTSSGTAVEGATEKDFIPDLSDGRQHYFYCQYSYMDAYGETITGDTRVASCIESKTMTFTVSAVAGEMYFGDGGTKNVEQESYRYTRLEGDSSSTVLVQAVGSESIMSACLHTSDGVAQRGFQNCDYLTYQWYKGSSQGDKAEPVGDTVTVSGFNNTQPMWDEQCDAIANIHVRCPSDEVGEYTLTVVVTAWRELEGEKYSFSAESSYRVRTLEKNEELYTVDADGTLTGYTGRESVLNIPASVGGVAVKKIGKLSVGNSLLDGTNPGPRKLIVPEGVEAIDAEAFIKISSLSELVLPSTLRSIGSRAFFLCDIRSITIPEGLESIGSEAFRYGFAPGAVLVLPASLQTIGSNAFGDADLSEVIFNPDSFPSFSGYAFHHCGNLERVVLPANAEGKLEGNCNFARCDKLYIVENTDKLLPVTESGSSLGDNFMASPCTAYISDTGFFENGYLYDVVDGEYAVLRRYLGEIPENWVLPEALGGYPLKEIALQETTSYDISMEQLELVADKSQVKRIVFPSTLERIGDMVFMACPNLYSVSFTKKELGEGEGRILLSSVGRRAFKYCTALQGALSFPADCLIDEEAFYGCVRLSGVNVDGVKLMNNAFSYCLSLTTVSGEWIPGGYHKEDGSTTVSFKGLVYFACDPAFPVSASLTHANATTLEPDTYKPFEDEDILIYDRTEPEPPYRIYSTPPYVYAGSAEDATLLLYTGVDDKSVVIPAEIYNEETGKTFHITDVAEHALDYVGLRSASYNWTLGVPIFKPESAAVHSSYTLSFDEGIEAIRCHILNAESVDFPDSLSFVPDDVFTSGSIHNTVLKKANIPLYLSALPANFFGGCVSLESVEWNEKLTALGNGAFIDCAAYVGDNGSLILPAGIKTFGQSVFLDSGVKEITLSENIETVAWNAFKGLDTVTILSPSASLPVFDSEYAWNRDSVGCLVCYENSATHLFAQRCKIDFRLLEAENLRYLELTDPEGRSIAYDALGEVNWYDADGSLLGSGISIADTDLSAPVMCTVSFAEACRTLYQVPPTMSFTLEAGVRSYTLQLVKRETVTVHGVFREHALRDFRGELTLDTGFSRKEYALAEYMDAETGELELTLPRYPLSLRVQAQGYREFELNDLQMLAVNGEIELGTVELTPVPREYAVIFSSPEGQSITDLTLSLSVFNKTTDECLDPYLTVSRRWGTTYLSLDTIIWQHWDERDEVELRVTSENIFDRYYVAEAVPLPYNGGEEGVTVDLTERGTVSFFYSPDACCAVFDEDGNRLVPFSTIRNHELLYLPAGSYIFLCCKITSKIIDIDDVDFFEKAGISEDCYVRAAFEVSDGENTRVQGYPAAAATTNDIKYSWGSKSELALDGYVPVFLSFDCSEDYSANAAERTILLEDTNSVLLNFMKHEDCYAYLQDADGVITEQHSVDGGGRQRPYLSVTTTATKGTLVVYYNPNGVAADHYAILNASLRTADYLTSLGSFLVKKLTPDYTLSELVTDERDGRISFTVSPAIPKNSELSITANGEAVGDITLSSSRGSDYSAFSFAGVKSSVVEYAFSLRFKDETHETIDLGTRRVVNPDCAIPVAQYVDITIDNPNGEGGKLSHSSCRLYSDGRTENSLFLIAAGYHMNEDNTLQQAVTYDFKLKISHSELVKENSVRLTAFASKNRNETQYTVNLRYNAETDTFDGTLVFEEDRYTISDLVYGVKFDFAYSSVPTEGFTVKENDSAIHGKLEDRYEEISSLLQQAQTEAETVQPIDTELVDEFLTYYAADFTEDEKTALRYSVALYNIRAECSQETAEAIAALPENLFGDFGLTQDAGTAEILSTLSQGYCEQTSAEYSEAELTALGYQAQSVGEGACFYLRAEDNAIRLYDPLSLTETRVYLTAESKPAKKLMAKKTLAKSGSSELDTLYNKLKANAAYQKSDNASGLISKCLYFYNLTEALIKRADQNATRAETILRESRLQRLGNEANMLSEEVSEAFTDYLKANGKALIGEVSQLPGREGLLQAAEEYKTAWVELSAKLKEVQSSLGKAREAIEKGEKVGLSKGVNIAAKTMARFANVMSGVGLVFDAADLFFQIVDGYGEACFKTTKYLNIADSVMSMWYRAQNAYDRDCLDTNNSFIFERSREEQLDACRETVKEMLELLDTRHTEAWAAYYIVMAEGFAVIAGDIAGFLSKNPVAALSGLALSGVQNITILYTVFVDWTRDSQLDSLYDDVFNECYGPSSSCEDEEDSSEEDDSPVEVPTKTVIDPAGYVYEAVASNKVEGAEATIYYKNEEGAETEWNADEYAQQNHQITDSEGVFQWFTPKGEWLVKATKEGSEVGTSVNDPNAVDGWLPVPPAQMEVYISMESKAAPTVVSARSGENCVRVLFSQYMDIAQLEENPSLLSVTVGGTAVETAFTFPDAEVSPKDSTVFYGRVLELRPKDGGSFSGSVSLRIDGSLRNYAGKALSEDFVGEDMPFVQLPAKIEHSYPNRYMTDVSEEGEIVVALTDTCGRPIEGAEVHASFAYGGTLRLSSDSVVTDSEGRAVFTARGISSGKDILTFYCDSVSVQMNTGVNPLGTVAPAKPEANLSDFVTVEEGAELVLQCASENAVIRYTTNNTCPCHDDALTYEGPITVKEDTFFRIAAWTKEGGYSERLNLHILTTPIPYGEASYVWNGNQCTATRVSATDENQKETETVKAQYVKDTSAKCTENEKGHYEATFTNTAFAKQSTAKSSVEQPDTALSHSYGEVSYTWTGDTCTAERVCQNDSTHKESETVKAQYVKDTSAKCTENEKGHYEATFTNTAFAKQSTAKSSVEQPDTALSHSYGEVSYTWTGDTCTAERVCQNDSTHKESETVTGQYVKDTSATCTENEKGHYEATFTNSAFAKQSTAKSSVEKPDTALSHSYGEASYTWTGDTCTAERVCQNDSTHKESESVKAILSNGFYEASFTNPAFTKQRREAEKGNTLLIPISECGENCDFWLNGRRLTSEKRSGSFALTPESTGGLLIGYTYNDPATDEAHRKYPVSMKVWLISEKPGGEFQAELLSELDNLLRYEGFSIRVTGKRGIRMVTGIDSSLRSRLQKGISINGKLWTLESYGTLFCWAKDYGAEEALTLENVGGYAQFAKAYQKGKLDTVLARSGKELQWTNVIVKRQGDFTSSDIRNDFVLRSVLVLRSGEEELVIYGAPVTRSIGYIATQVQGRYSAQSKEGRYISRLLSEYLPQ